MALGCLWWHAWFPVDAVVAAAVGVAGVALGDIDLHFAWQAWHLATWTCTLRGRCGTWRHSSSLCLAWRGIWPVDAVVAAAIGVAGVTLRGRRGTWRHGLSPCLAGVALMALGCLWWHAWFPVDAVVAAAVGVAGVALGDIDLHFAWQALHLATWTFTLHGRRGTWRHRPSLCAAGVALPSHGPSLCVAGVALGDMDLHFAWQAWHLWHWAASDERLVPVWRRCCRGCWRGRRGTWWHRRSFGVAGVALGDIHAASHTIFHTQLCHTFFCHTFFCHTQLGHTHLRHTQLCHTQLCHTPSFTHHLSHTTLSHTHTTLCHTQLCQTHNLSHTTLRHTTLHIQFLKWSILHHLLCPFFFLRAASTTFSDYWKKLTCGVIRSFNFSTQLAGH